MCQLIILPKLPIMREHPPCTPESVAAAKAAAERERESLYDVEVQRDMDKLELLRLIDLYGIETVEHWLGNVKAGLLR